MKIVKHPARMVSNKAPSMVGRIDVHQGQWGENSGGGERDLAGFFAVRDPRRQSPRNVGGAQRTHYQAHRRVAEVLPHQEGGREARR
jgi:hypothetical protein